MFRRSFTFLLVLLTLANQSLCLAQMEHQHDAGEPEGHDSRPHFHWGGHSHHKCPERCEQEGHRHEDDPCQDDSHAATHADEHAPAPLSNLPLHGEHDSDAIYGGVDVTLARTSSIGTIHPDKDWVTGLIIQRVEHRRAAPLEPSVAGGRSFFPGDDACPVYLRALSLRL